MATIFDYSAQDIQGKELRFSDYKGKVLLIVNIASKCGFTPQLGGLEDLYKKYRDRGFEIIAFPCNQFFQEPLENEKISDFCTSEYGATFRIMEKTKVRGGDKHPVYVFLSDRKLNGKVGTAPLWNFYKYLLGRDGKVIEVFSSMVSPTSQELISKIESALG